jgi:hypothetical protein
MLTQITIPNTVTNIECYAFDGCSSLTNIVIPRTVTSIGFNPIYNTTNDSFGRCKNLKAITVDTNNPVYSSLDGVLFNKDRTKLIQFPAGRAGSYTVPNGVTCIGNRAFDGCDRLTGVKIPKTVTSIGDNAFMGCPQLRNIKIPSSVTSIGTCIFLYDRNLDHFVFPNGVTNLGSQVPPPPLPLD